MTSSSSTTPSRRRRKPGARCRHVVARTPLTSATVVDVVAGTEMSTPKRKRTRTSLLEGAAARTATTAAVATAAAAACSRAVHVSKSRAAVMRARPCAWSALSRVQAERIAGAASEAASTRRRYCDRGVRRACTRAWMHARSSSARASSKCARVSRCAQPFRSGTRATFAASSMDAAWPWKYRMPP